MYLRLNNLEIRSTQKLPGAGIRGRDDLPVGCCGAESCGANT